MGRSSVTMYASVVLKDIQSKKEIITASDANFFELPYKQAVKGMLGFQGVKAEVFDDGAIILRNHLGQFIEIV